MPTVLERLFSTPQPIEQTVGQPRGGGGTVLDRLFPPPPSGTFTEGLIGRGKENIQSLMGLPRAMATGFGENIQQVPSILSGFKQAAGDLIEDPLGTIQRSAGELGEAATTLGRNIATDVSGGVPDREVSGPERAGRITADVAELLLGGTVASGAKRALQAPIKARRAAQEAMEAATRATGRRAEVADIVAQGRELISPKANVPLRASQRAQDVISQPRRGPALPSASALPREAEKVLVSRKAVEALQGRRREVGSERLARATGLSKEEIKGLAPGVSTTPIEVEDAFLDAGFRNRIGGLSSRPGTNPPFGQSTLKARTPTAATPLVEVAKQRPMGFKEILDEGQKRGLGPKQVAEEMVRSLKDDAGFSHQTLLASLAGGTGGALTGAALFADDPEASLGGAIALGLIGAIGAPSLLNFATQSPGVARGTFRELADKANNAVIGLRSELALSGLAAPKNVAAAIGAPITAGLEKKSLKPLKEALRLPTNVREFTKGLVDTGDIGIAGSQRPQGPFGRLISGVDAQADAALRRAGLTQAEANRILVKTPMVEILPSKLLEIFKSPVVRQVLLFQRTPMNVFVHGLDELKNLNFFTEGFNRRNLTTIGTAGLGAIAGLATDDMNPYHRLMLFGFLGAMMGVRQIPFGMAGATVGATEALGGVAPFPEFGFDLQAAGGGIVEPSGIRVLRRLEEESKKGQGARRGFRARSVKRERKGFR